jgi:hypothetical protein
VGAPARRKGSFSLLSSQLQLSSAERHPRAAPKVRNRSNAFLAFERFRWRAVKKRFFRPSGLAGVPSGTPGPGAWQQADNKNFRKEAAIK